MVKKELDSTSEVESNSFCVARKIDSNHAALNDLDRLSSELYLSNANGKNIIIHGYLHSGVQWTPDRSDMATTEPYQEFTLTDWEMKTPFFGDTYEKRPSRYRLRRSDFE